MSVLENHWKIAGEPTEGWIWPAETKDGHINHDSLKLRHGKTLKAAKLRPFEVYSIRHTFLTRLGERAAVMSGPLRELQGIRLTGHNSRHSAENTIPVEGRELRLTDTASVG